MTSEIVSIRIDDLLRQLHTRFGVNFIVGKGVRGYPSDEFYLNQHVFNGEYSYFGKLVTKKLTPSPLVGRNLILKI